MDGEVCMNSACKDRSASQWKKGWPLLSGGFARLCNKCGTAYQNSVFCHKFHPHESGWRKCSYCSKLIHCGCVVSRSSFEYLDLGGIGCVTCLKASQHFLMHDNENPNESARSTNNKASDGDEHTDSAGEGKLMQLCKIAEASESNRWPQAERDAIVSCIGPNNKEAKCLFREDDKRFSNVMKQSSHSSTFTTAKSNRPTWETKSMHGLLSLSASLGTSSGNCALSSATEIVEDRLDVKEYSPFAQGKSSYHPILPKPLKSGLIMNLETNKDMISQARIARPPAEGKGKNDCNILSRYWPRITDQELEQLSGDLKSTVVPLFEKVLSVSDASRIGRLVLPKACAEAYFPPISQSEGIPLHIQDVKGNEWTFQFRFWPNNNSRMYVLEGVTPCIQSMQLNAGDTVTFSRIDPGGKYVMGVRRAPNCVYTQVAPASAHSNGISTKETTFSGAAENLHSESSFLYLLQSRKGNGEPYLNGNSEYLHLGTRTADWLQSENCEEMMNNDTLQRLISVSEKKRTRNIGSKTKRLHIYSEDSMELRLAWDAMDLLCPPPSVKPSIEIIDDVEIEEYNEPPVLRKGIICSVCPSGSLLPASEQPSPKELENLLRTNKDSKKEKSKSNQEHKPSGLDALASAVFLGDNLVDPVGVTTKHPRHRPGCTCIVCVQPPSGKARHKPTCTCLACLSMKRRFNTLRMRKKKHQSKHEEDAAQKDHTNYKGASGEDTSQLEEAGNLNRGWLEMAAPGARQIDLNCHPSHEDVQVGLIAGPSMNKGMKMA